MSLKKIIGLVAVGGIIVAGFFSYMVYEKALVDNTAFQEKQVYLYIPSGVTYEELQKQLSPYLKSWENFDAVAKNRKYDRNIKSGKFLIKKGMSNYHLIKALRNNLPVKVVFNNQESLGKLAQRLAAQTEPDSLSYMNAFTNVDFLEENEFTEENILAMFLPNTYEFYWNTSATKVAEKMAKEYRKFWNDKRKMLAFQKKLKPVEVSILASIVHKETTKVSERPRVAGVYLNRLATGMPLQADPTVIYALKKATGDFDQVIKRVLFDDLKMESPYNTYLHAGLPPGPIAMPDISAIEAVLNAEKHDYYYFCASPDKPGYHSFASNHAQHEQNAKKYRNWVSSIGIKR